MFQFVCYFFFLAIIDLMLPFLFFWSLRLYLNSYGTVLNKTETLGIDNSAGFSVVVARIEYETNFTIRFGL